MSTFRHAKLFKNGANQAVRIPREGDKLIIEAAPAPSLLAVLAGLSAIDEDLPNIDDPSSGR